MAREEFHSCRRKDRILSLASIVIGGTYNPELKGPRHSSTNTGNVRLLTGKNAVIYGAGGATGRAVAHAFAREGARVFLTGRNLTKVEQVAKEITAAGGAAEAAQIDALNEDAVEKHFAAIVGRLGRLIFPSMPSGFLSKTFKAFL